MFDIASSKRLHGKVHGFARLPRPSAPYWRGPIHLIRGREHGARARVVAIIAARRSRAKEKARVAGGKQSAGLGWARADGGGGALFDNHVLSCLLFVDFGECVVSKAGETKWSGASFRRTIPPPNTIPPPLRRRRDEPSLQAGKQAASGWGAKKSQTSAKLHGYDLT